jgi:ribosomal protein S18 acetylase RimI-like enzyme
MAQMTPTIVPATVEDSAAILELQKLCFQSEAELYDDPNIPPLLETLDELCHETAETRMLKLSIEGTVMGSVRAHMERGTCHIGRLMVHPDHQHQGFGSRLVTAIEREFPTAQRFEIFTGSRSEGNIALYQRLGYNEFRRHEAHPGLTLVFLEKPNR